jgi:hypothetical protein
MHMKSSRLIPVLVFYRILSAFAIDEDMTLEPYRVPPLHVRIKVASLRSIWDVISTVYSTIWNPDPEAARCYDLHEWSERLHYHVHLFAFMWQDQS